jgi:hypothetical protein
MNHRIFAGGYLLGQRLDTQIGGARANSIVALIRALGGACDAPATVSANER